MNFLVLLYGDGSPVRLDNTSGGYPIRARRSVDAHIFSSEDERTRYQEMFPKEDFKKAILYTSFVREE